MRFTLTYEGPLPPRQRQVSPLKTQLREAFHPQIAEQMSPYLSHDLELDFQVGGRSFACVVTEKYRNEVELDVLLLTPRSHRRPGDADNRIKTLLDGLTLPKNAEQAGTSSQNDPQWCLLEDDSLVRRYSLSVEHWLGRDVGVHDTLAIVRATVITAGIGSYGGVSLSL